MLVIFDDYTTGLLREGDLILLFPLQNMLSDFLIFDLFIQRDFKISYCF